MPISGREFSGVYELNVETRVCAFFLRGALVVMLKGNQLQNHFGVQNDPPHKQRTTKVPRLQRGAAPSKSVGGTSEGSERAGRCTSHCPKPNGAQHPGVLMHHPLGVQGRTRKKEEEQKTNTAAWDVVWLETKQPWLLLRRSFC